MKRVFALGPWLMDLVNPPPRNSLSLVQKLWRVMLVTVTIVTLCIVVALGGALVCFAWQRSREFLQGVPQLREGLLILVTAGAINAGCVYVLLQIKRLDRMIIPSAAEGVEVLRPPRGSPSPHSR